MIKVTVLDLLNAEFVLGKLKKIAETDGCDFGLSYKIFKFVEKLQDPYKEIYEQREKILSKFGESDKEKEGQISIPPENTDDFNKYWNQLLESEVEVFNVFKFKQSDFEGLTDSFTMSDVAQLHTLIEEIEEVAPRERKKINIDFDEDENIEVENLEEDKKAD